MLDDQEKNIKLELKLINERLEKTKQPSETTQAHNPKCKFREFLCKYGRHGGWDPSQHAVYVKMRGVSGFYAKCAAALNLSVEDIESHETWFREFNRLEMLQKKEIEDWKDKKVKQLEEKKLLLEEQVETEPAIAQPKMPRKDSTKELIAYHEQKQRELELQREQKERVRRQELERFEKRRLETAQRLQQLSVEKTRMKHQEWITQVLNAKADAKPANQPKLQNLVRSIQDFQSRDAELLQRRKMELIRKDMAKKEKVQRIEQLKSNVFCVQIGQNKRKSGPK
jgi:hypothetical protein